MIRDLFDLMDKWRHYPNWQLERRADIFFALYLEEILSVVNVEKVNVIVPEFPVRIGEIYDADVNKSKKIDYVVLSESEIILVELKTDNSSRREEQDDYLKRSQQVGITKLISGVKKIYQATNSKSKYDNLMADIAKFEAVDGIEKLPIRIVYVQPNGDENNVVNFKKIASLESISDEVGVRFRQSLLEWSEIKAGDNNIK